MQGVLEAAVAKITGEPRPRHGQRADRRGRARPGPGRRFRTGVALPADVLPPGAERRVCRDDVAVLDAAEAAEGFHPIRDAVRKRYRYVIHDGPVRDVFRRRYCLALPPAARRRGHAPRRPGACRARTISPASQPAAPSGASSVRTVYEIRVAQRAGSRASGDLDHRRGRGRRLPLQHGPRDRRHAGRSRPRRTARVVARRSAAGSRPTAGGPTRRRRGCSWFASSTRRGMIDVDD